MQLTEDFEELLKQAEEKYSPLQRAIEEKLGPNSPRKKAGNENRLTHGA